MKNNPPLHLKEGIHVLMLIDMGVSSSNKGSKRWINKIITSNAQQWDKASEKLIQLQNHLNDPDVRLYASINSRNMQKAINTFQHKQLDVQEDNKVNFYRRINDSFCSCLLQPENRRTSLFLLDCYASTAAEINSFTIKNRDIPMSYMYHTPNGFHAIMHPFNPILLEGYNTIELKKDALMLINWISHD